MIASRRGNGDSARQISDITSLTGDEPVRPKMGTLSRKVVLSVLKRSREMFARGFGFLMRKFMEVLRAVVVRFEWIGGDKMWTCKFCGFGITPSVVVKKLGVPRGL